MLHTPEGDAVEFKPDSNKFEGIQYINLTNGTTGVHIILYRLPKLEVDENSDKEEEQDIKFQGKKYWSQINYNKLRKSRLKLSMNKMRQI